VGVYYLDTSALVKRYLTETGSPWVRSVTDPKSGHDIFVARITGVESVSAFVRQVPPLPNLAAVLADFKFDFHKQYQRLALTNAVIATGMRLAESYRLRGYDAVQLAAAWELNAVRSKAGLPPLSFVSADNQLNAAASAESLAVDNPNAHP
jgi:predicted nucleic acid-binding protein